MTVVPDVASLFRRGRSLPERLDAVAAAMAEPLGFGTVAVNLYRPAFDDFEVVAVHGSTGARDTLLGTRTSAEAWNRLMNPRFRRRDAYVVQHGAFDWQAEFTASWVPPGEPNDSAVDGWHPEDAIFVPLRDSSGQVLGIVSVDEPLSGLRPTDEQLDALAAVAAQGGQAIEAAQHVEAAQRHRAAVEQLLRVSARLTEQPSVDDLLAAVAEALRDALGFEKVTIWLAARDELVVRGSLGWQPSEIAPAMPLDTFDRLFEPQRLEEGCVLLEQADAHALVPPRLHSVYKSQRNGSGPLGWRNHWLVVPMRRADGTLAGVIWADDPVDHLVPAPERLQALRALANQAASGVEAARRLEELRHLADHDPLTGLRNRRGLYAQIDAHLDAGAAVIVADLDHFKRVNDGLGYPVGDAVLREISQLIASACRTGDLAVRLGGEEFALVLPGTDARGALAVAERLRRSVSERVRSVPWGMSLSAGVTAGGRGSQPEDLLRDATRALFAAKRLGRNRCVIYAADTLETLLEDVDREEASSEQLAAVMMLAETLDLRDAGTARHSSTVGAFARSIADTLGWPADRVERLRVAGVLHDIGKLAVADSILHKAGRLTPEEREEIERHPEVGARILERANLRDVAEWVACHHERVDGTGYPNRLSADAIPVEARILAVTDAYEAMIADRPYRAGMSPECAQAELRRHAGTQFDAHIVDAFLGVLAAQDAPAS